jgi:hypothetical protein
MEKRIHCANNSELRNRVGACARSRLGKSAQRVKVKGTSRRKRIRCSSDARDSRSVEEARQASSASGLGRARADRGRGRARRDMAGERHGHWRRAPGLGLLIAARTRQNNAIGSLGVTSPCLAARPVGRCKERCARRHSTG